MKLINALSWLNRYTVESRLNVQVGTQKFGRRTERDVQVKIIFRITPCKVFWTRLYHSDVQTRGTYNRETYNWQVRLYCKTIRKGFAAYRKLPTTPCLRILRCCIFQPKLLNLSKDLEVNFLGSYVGNIFSWKGEITGEFFPTCLKGGERRRPWLSNASHKIELKRSGE